MMTMISGDSPAVKLNHFSSKPAKIEKMLKRSANRLPLIRSFVGSFARSLELCVSSSL